MLAVLVLLHSRPFSTLCVICFLFALQGNKNYLFATVRTTAPVPSDPLKGLLVRHNAPSLPIGYSNLRLVLRCCLQLENVSEKEFVTARGKDGLLCRSVHACVWRRVVGIERRVVVPHRQRRVVVCVE